MWDRRSRFLRCNPAGFDVGSDRSGRDSWFDGSGFHFINIKSMVAGSACGDVGEGEHFPAFRADNRSGKSAPGSYVDLGAEFDDPVRRDVEKIGRPRRNARKARVEARAPPCHPGPRTHCDIGAADEEGDLARIEFQPRDFRPAELPRYVWRLGKTEVRLDLPKTAAELAGPDPVCTGDPGNVFGDDPNEQHRLVQHFVVLQVVQQGHGHVFGLGGEKHCGARDAGFRGVFTGGEEGGERNRLAP